MNPGYADARIMLRANTTRKCYGLNGAFHGDETKLERVQTLLASIKTATVRDVVTELIFILGQLPRSGRLELVRDAVKARDDIILALNESCYATAKDDQDSEEDFVVLCTDGSEQTKRKELIPNMHYIFILLLGFVSTHGATGVELFRMYQQSTSTRHESAFLTAIALNSTIDDKEMLNLYLTAPEYVRSAIVNVLREKNVRPGMVKELHDRNLAMSHKRVEAMMSAAELRHHVRSVETSPLRNWRLFSDIHFELLTDAFEKYKSSPLCQGIALSDWAARVDAGDFRRVDAKRLMDICYEYMPMTLADNVDTAMAIYLRKLSTDGHIKTPSHDDGPAQIQGITGMLPPQKLMDKLLSKDQWEWILRSVKDAGLYGPYATVAASYIEGWSKKRKVSSEVVKFACDCLDAAPRAAVEGKSGAIHAPQVLLYNAVVKLRDGVFSKTRLRVNQIRDLASATARLYLRITPPTHPQQDSADSTEGTSTRTKAERQADLTTAWDTWITTWATTLFVVNARVVPLHHAYLKMSNPKVLRNNATLYGGFSRILLDMQLELLAVAEAASAGDGPDFSTQPFVPPVRSLNLQYQLLKPFTPVEKMVKRAHALFPSAQSLEQHLYTIVRTRYVPQMVAQVKEYGRLDKPHPLDHGVFRFAWQYLKDPDIAREYTELMVLCKSESAAIEAKRSLPFVQRTNPYGAVVVEKIDFQLYEELEYFSTDGQYAFDICRHAASPDSAAALRQLIRDKWELLRDPVNEITELSRKPLSTPPGDLKGYFDNYRYRIKFYSHVQTANMVEVERDTILHCALLKHLWMEDCVTDDERSLYSDAVQLEKMGLLDAFIEKANSYNSAHNPSAPILTRASMFIGFLDGDISISEIKAQLVNNLSDREPSTREQARTNLMGAMEGCEQFDTCVDLLVLLAKKLTNESGLYRNRNNLESLVPVLVERSYKHAQEVSEDSAIRLTKQLLNEGLVRIITDDVSKRDSVNKDQFRRIATVIIKTTLVGNLLIFDDEARTPASDGCHSNALHSVWIEGAIRLDAIVVQAIQGNSGLSKYAWPENLTELYPKVYLKPCEMEGVVRTFLETQVLTGRYWANNLRNYVFLERWHIDHTRVPVAQSVDLMVNGLNAVLGAHFPDVTKPTASTIRSRIEKLFEMVDLRWNEVPYLQKALATATKACQTDTTKASYDALYKLMELSSDKIGLGYLLPPMTEACEMLLTTAVDRNYPLNDCDLVERWIEARRGKNDFDVSALTEQQLRVILATSVMRPLPTVPIADDCAIARELLTMSPSAVHIDFVKKTLLDSRDDLLGPYLTTRAKWDCYGVFHKDYVHEAEIEGEPPIPFDTLSNASNLTSECMALYGDRCREQALSKHSQAALRAQKLEAFITLPSTTSEEVIALAKEINEGPLMQTLTLCLFKTDAVWHVLSYLLQPDVIANSNQRLTADILEQTAKAVHEDKVLTVFSTLLSGTRRKAMSLYLLKCILRALSEINTSESVALLQSEWARATAEGPSDISYELVRISVQQLCSSVQAHSKLRPLMWDILAAAAALPRLDVESVMLLLSIRWKDKASQETLDKRIDECFMASKSTTTAPSFTVHGKTQEKWNLEKWIDTLKANKKHELSCLPGEVEAEALCSKASHVICTLRINTDNPHIKALAACVETAFAYNALTGAVTEAEISTLGDQIMRGVPESVSDIQRLVGAVRMAAATAYTTTSLNRALKALPEANRSDKTKIQQVVSQSAVAKAYTGVVGRVLDVYVDTPQRAVQQRLYLQAVRRVSEHGSMWEELLVLQPHAGVLSLLAVDERYYTHTASRASGAETHRASMDIQDTAESSADEE